MKSPAQKDYPKHVLIGPHQVPYSIRFVTGKKWLGMCSFKRKLIWLNAKQSRPELFMTFLHELLHAIEFESGLKVKHKLIYQFEEGLFNFFINNVATFKFGEGDE